MSYISVAIDGPAGAGKSSVAKVVAKETGFVYVDTGAMYRAAAYAAIQKGINIENSQSEVEKLVGNIEIALTYHNGVLQVYLDGEDISDKIRTPQISKGASAVATMGGVRKKLVLMQQEMAKKADIIMDGRDICSTVLPNATIKIFLTASVDTRAKRRYYELVEKGEKCDFEQIKLDIIARDKNDSEREISPLRKTDDSLLIDTSDMTFNEVVDKIKNLIKDVSL